MSRSRFLEPTDLRLLGKYYQSGPRLMVLVSPQSMAIVPRPMSLLFIATTLALPSVVCGVLFILGWPGAVQQLGMFAGPMFALIGLLAIGGPIALESFRYQYLKSCSPLLSCDRSTGTVSILAGRTQFPMSSVHCLLGLSMPDSNGDTQSELQLIAKEDDSLVPHLICTAYHWSARRCFGTVMADFARESAVPILFAEPNGIFKRGPITILTEDGEPLRIWLRGCHRISQSCSSNIINATTPTLLSDALAEP